MSTLAAESTIRCIPQSGGNRELHTALIATEHLSIFAHTNKNLKTTLPIFHQFKAKYLHSDTPGAAPFIAYGKQGDVVPLSICNFDFTIKQQLNRCFVAYTVSDKEVIGLINITPFSSSSSTGEISITLTTSDQILADEFLAGIKFFLKNTSEKGIGQYDTVLCSTEDPMVIEAMRHNGFLEFPREKFISMTTQMPHRYHLTGTIYQEAYPMMKFELIGDSRVRSFTTEVTNTEWHDVVLMYLPTADQTQDEDARECSGACAASDDAE